MNGITHGSAGNGKRDNKGAGMMEKKRNSFESFENLVDRISEKHIDSVVVRRNVGNFHIKFPNRHTLSIGFGQFHYCSHDGTNAEIAIWDSSEAWYTFDDGDTVQGYVSIADIEAWADRIANDELKFTTS